MPVKPRKLETKLRKIGAEVSSEKKATGHRTVRYKGRRSQIPFHGGGYEISDKLLAKILRDLGLKKNDIGL